MTTNADPIIDLDPEDVDDDHGRGRTTTVGLAPALFEPDSRTQIEAVKDRLAMVREFMAEALTEGANGEVEGDFARIPGCGSKPVLLQPGADKLARLFNLAVNVTRTGLDTLADGHIVVSYRAIVSDQDGRPIGDVEAFASTTEKTFREGPNTPLNTLARRAAKRARVAAIVQATGVSDLFSSQAEAPAKLSDRQVAILTTIVTLKAPDMLEVVQAQIAQTRAEDWKRQLWSVLQLGELSSDDLARIGAELVGDEATASDALRLLTAKAAE